jgi:hypothetical protein
MLNIFAGQSASAPGIDIRSFVTINNKKINPVKFRNNVAYVMQDDGLLQTATTREERSYSLLGTDETGWQVHERDRSDSRYEMSTTFT